MRDELARRTESVVEETQMPDVANMLRTSIAELPEQTQLVIVLRLVEGMSGNEVKSLLGCSASEVSRRLHNGMDHLRQVWRDRLVLDK